MTEYRRVERKTNREIGAEWDILAPLRHHQIRSGADTTFHDMIVPNLLAQLNGRFYKRVLDVGCGTGELTNILAAHAERVHGVDLSTRSIEIARAQERAPNVSYFRYSVENFADEKNFRYDLVVANMVLMDVMHLQKVLTSISGMMKRYASLIFSITHPAFWSDYYGYGDEGWFDYDDEIFIEGPFRITADRKVGTKGLISSTHVHRPLSMYVQQLRDAGLQIVSLVEPIPGKYGGSVYHRAGKFPRYLIAKCELRSRPGIRVI